MKKALVEIYIPTLELRFDALLPREVPLYDTLPLLTRAANQLSGGRFIQTGETVLCHREDGSIINMNMSPWELGIENGSQLMLI